MKTLFTHWYIWMPLLAVAIFLLVANRDKDNRDDPPNSFPGE